MRDPLRFCGYPLGQHFGTGETKVREPFVAPKEIDHIDALRLTGMRRFRGCEEHIDGDMDLHVLQLFTDGRTEADLVGSSRAGDKESAAVAGA
jgi:hypothetical protein